MMTLRLSFFSPSRRPLIWAAALGAVFVARSASAQPDDYPDEPPAPPPKVQPKPPPPKPPVAKPPAPKPPAALPPAPKPPQPSGGADQPSKPPPRATAPVPPRPLGRPPAHRPSDEALKRLRDRLPSGKGKPSKHGKAEPQKSHPKKKHAKDEHGYCIGRGMTDRPTEINLVHGWLGVNNDKAVPAPKRQGTFDWAWWKWQLTPYMWRYENHDDHCDARNQPIPLLANIINLGVLLFLFARFGRKPVAEALRKRKKTIMSELDKAQSIKKSAQDRLAHYEDELTHLDDTLVALREKYVAEGELEETRVINAAGEARDRMLADVAFRVTQESKSARDDLSRQALDGALAAAEKLLEGKVTKADHDRLAEEYLAHIGPALKKKQATRRAGGTA